MSSNPDRRLSDREVKPRLAARRWLASPEMSVVLVLLALMIGMGCTPHADRFFSGANLDSVARSTSLLTIFAIGELLVIITGGIDLSLGSLIAFGGMLLARILTDQVKAGAGELPATLLGAGAVLAFSLALGAVHATLIHRLRLPAFVVTLASMSILRSAARVLNDAVPISIVDYSLVSYLGSGKLYLVGTPIGIPVPTVIMLGIAAIVTGILVGTPIGRRIYALGSNEEATRLSGVSIYRVRLFVYSGCGLLSGVAAILYAGYGGQGDPSSGTMAELNAISAVVIGGAALSGGRGSVPGTLLGAALIQSIISVINFTVPTPALWEGTVVGGVLLFAVVFNRLRQIGTFSRWRRPEA